MINELMYYSPMDVQFTLLGKTISGYAEDNFIVIEPQNDTSTMKDSMDGRVQITQKPNAMYTVTLSLQQTSPDNTLLSALHTIYKRFGKTLKLPLIIKDHSTGTVMYATDVFFRREPTVTFGSGMNTMNWEFNVKNPTFTIAGNPLGDNSEIERMINQAVQLAGYLDIDLSSILGTVNNLFESVTDIFI